MTAPDMYDRSKPRNEPCTCNYLQNAAADPLNPIVFEETGRMYHFTYPDPECDDDDSECGLARLLIYHCPLCGGAAPKSKALS